MNIQKFTHYNQDAQALAKALLGKRLYHKHNDIWLSARIIETEAYYLSDKASHSWLGRTPSREAMFMPAGTIYMYYCRGMDALNISAQGDGNAVLIKAGFPVGDERMVQAMQSFHEQPKTERQLCKGQSLLCRSLQIHVKDWNTKSFNEDFFVAEDDYQTQSIIQTTRLGISPERDAHLPYRFIDEQFVKDCTKNPLTMRTPPLYQILSTGV